MSLTETALRRAVADLSLIKFFPGEPDFRAALSMALTKICATDAELDRVVQKYTLCFSEWQGIHELRACASSMFKPADGVEVDSIAVNKVGRLIYPEGLPAFAELRNPALAAIPAAARRLDLPAVKQIEAAEHLHSAEFTVDPELEKLVRETAAACKAPEVPKPRTVAEIEQILYAKKSVA